MPRHEPRGGVRPAESGFEPAFEPLYRARWPADTSISIITTTFFLHILEGRAGANGQKAKAILDLYDEMKQTVPEVIQSQYAIATIDALFGAPVFSSAEFYEQVGITKVSGAKILKDLEENELVRVLQRGAGR